MDLLARVRRFIREHDLARPGSRIVAAVSGGSDSTALAHLLDALDRCGDLQLAGLAHFNHQLRPAADDDERFVERLAESFGRRFVSDREDVAARAARDGQSIEHAARSARHEFFERARLALGADVVATGHTRDDQAETFLLRLLRGAGPRGLAGMHARSGRVVRPLLDCRRDELRTWLDARGGTHVVDETNADRSIPRNRVREELLPLLAERFNPNVVNVLADEADLLQEVWAWLDAESDAHLRTVDRSVDRIALDIRELSRMPLPLRRVVVWRAMSEAAGDRHVDVDHVAAVIRLIDPANGTGAVDMPGHRAQRIAGRLVLEMGAAKNAALNLFRYQLSIPGEVRIGATGCVVSAEEHVDAPAIGRAGAGNDGMAVVRRDLVRESLVVRNRRPGDRFRPIGLNGWKKLQDLFVDRKVARDERDRVPLVVDECDERDRIVWVAGFGIDEAFRVTDAAQAVLLLRLTRT